MGAMAYLASPLWLLFLLAGMLLALYASLVPPNYFPDGWALFPTWPQIDAQRAIDAVRAVHAGALRAQAAGVHHLSG